MTRPGPLSSPGLRLAAALLAAGLVATVSGALADAFGGAYYDAATDSLVVTMLYGGTNPDHIFTLQWGTCSTGTGGVSEVPAEVLDSQWRDAALHDYSETVHFGLGALPCRPAEVTLRTAPKFIYTVFVPNKKSGMRASKDGS